MADCGDLEKLPPEIRNEIYALVLVQAGPFDLCNFGGDQKRLGEPTSRRGDAPCMENEWARSDKAKVARVGQQRRLKGIGHKYVGRGKWVEVPSNVALLCVNKRIYAEATPILYSRTKFRFESAGTLHRFVDLIGDNTQHLRDIGMLAGGWKFRLGFYEARYAMEALTAGGAKNIRTFEVTHADLCPNVDAENRRYLPGIHRLVRLCRPLLDSLKVAYKNNNLDASVLEVIKITGCGGWGRRGRCRCTFEQEDEASAELQRMLRQKVAEQHNLEFES